MTHRMLGKCFSYGSPLPAECTVGCCKDEDWLEGSNWSPFLKLLLLCVAFLETLAEVALSVVGSWLPRIDVLL